VIDLASLDVEDGLRDALRSLEGEIEFTGFSDKGANGYVVFGTRTLLDRRVAIKFYPWADDRAHKEPKRLAEITSDHILEVATARVIDDDWAMIETPYCPRGDFERLVERTTLSLHTAILHTAEVLTGMSALHGASLVHRDLKPANVFLDDDGRARIGDFGSVRAIPSDQDDVSGSGHSALYRPPESFELGRYGRAGDLYQCGIFLYEVAGGHLPHDGVALLDREGRKCWGLAAGDFERSRCVDEAIARRAARAKLLDMGALPPTVPDRLKRVIRKATRPDPAGRYSSASEFISALQDARSLCLDWIWDGECAEAKLPGRRVRVVPDGSMFVAQCDMGSGWRRVNELRGSQPASVVREAEARYGT